MKLPPFLASAGLIALAGFNLQAAETSGSTSNAVITGPLADGTPPVPTPKPALPDFTLKSTVARRMNVEEAPEMSGLPMIRGTITATVHRVEDPGLPDPPEPLRALAVNDPAVIARLKELREKYPRRYFAFLSATVYDHSRTFLQWYANGVPGMKMSAWSNVDFNHFSGFSTFRITGADGVLREYSLMMGVGGVNTQRAAEQAARRGKTYQTPEIPALPDLAAGGPAFVIINGDSATKESTALMQGMHDLYRVEGMRMEAAYHARNRANEERRAYLLAHPPVPEDVTIQFWKPAKRTQTADQAERETP